MKIAFRLLTACLLAALVFPRLVQAGGDMGLAPYDIGEKLFARKDYRTALKYYRKALERNDVRAHYGLGLIYEETGKDRDALKHYRRFMDLGQSLTQHSDAVRRAGAIEERNKKKSTGKSTGPAERTERWKSLITKGNFREAEQVLLQAAAGDESNPEIHFYLGEVYMKLEDYGKAVAAYNKAKGYY